MCSTTAQDSQRILDLVERWAGEGLRTLGMAYRVAQAGEPADEGLAAHRDYVWSGLVAMEDPIREGVREAIQVAHRAGIQVKMITGDYRRTAERIARSVGLAADEDQVLEGQELGALSDEQLQKRVGRTVIFSRIRPQDKLRIVRALQASGEITAMIGDGVNDAPALKRANIGVVVGNATDVAKETADLILLDNNFRTVVAAIEEGRVIFENIRKVVAYTLSNSFAEVIAIFGAMLMNWPAPLTVAQILWVHLICDGPSDIVLGFEPQEPGIMDEKPKPLSEPILNRLGLSLIAVISTASAMVALGVFGHYWQAHNEIAEARTFAFSIFAVNSMVYIFAYRSLRRSLFRGSSLAQNKPLAVSVAGGLLLAVGAVLLPPIRNLLGIVPLHWYQWALVFGGAIGLLGIVEVAKYVSNRRQSPRLAAPQAAPR